MPPTSSDYGVSSSAPVLWSPLWVQLLVDKVCSGHGLSVKQEAAWGFVLQAEEIFAAGIGAGKAAKLKEHVGGLEEMGRSPLDTSVARMKRCKSAGPVREARWQHAHSVLAGFSTGSAAVQPHTG